MKVDNDHLIPDGKLQIDQNKVSSRYKQAKNQVPTTLQKKKSTYAVYRCAFCPYQSKQIGFARYVLILLLILIPINVHFVIEFIFSVIRKK